MFKCTAKDEVFTAKWKDVPQEDQEIIVKQFGLACYGHKEVGVWCEGCHYCEEERK